MNIYKDLQVSGYVMVPRALLLRVFEEHPVAGGDMEAFLRIMTYVNYADKVVKHRKSDVVCARGESIISFFHWSNILGWTVGRTRRLFERLIKDGNLEMVKDDCISHIRVLGYDVWTSKKHTESSGNSPMNESFENFWTEYHDTTHKPRQNRMDTLAAWKKLNADERKKAVEGIYDYYHHLQDTAYCRQAAKYLEKKLFLDEYD